MDGHNTPDCKGKWIDITTLSDPPPGKEKCMDCRAVRPRRSEDDPLPLTIPDQDEETDEDEEDAAAFRRYMRDANREVQGNRIFLSYLAMFFLGVASGVALVWWYLATY